MPNTVSNQTEVLPTRSWVRFVIVTAIFLCAVTCGLNAQHAEIPSIRSDNFALTQPELQVSLHQLRNDSDYVVGIQVDNNLQHNGSIEVGDFVTALSANRRYREFQSFTAIGREKLEVGSNSIKVFNLGECQGDLLLLLKVPKSTKVTIAVNGKTEFTGVPLNGTVLHHGQMVAAQFLGRNQLFSRLLFPELDSPQLEMVKTKNGYFWSQDALNKHLVRFGMPVNHPDAILGDVETVTIAVKIDTSGNVVLARALTGKEPFATEAVSAVGQARFSPFVVNGAAVDASGDVTMVFSKNGHVSSTLRQ